MCGNGFSGFGKGDGFMIITSRENKIFKLCLNLKTLKGRNENKLFIIEGMRSVRDAIAKGVEIFCVITKDGALIDFDVSCKEYSFAPKLFNEVCETVTPQGVMAVCKMKKYSLTDIKISENSCVVMCEALQDPGNIGTVIRTAHAASADGVVLTKGCCDLYNPKIIRSTMSSVFSVPVISGADTCSTIEYFKKNGYTIIAGALTDDAVDLYEADLSGKLLIIIGNEGNGVKEDTVKLCDKVLKIPMRSDAESLNAAVAGAVMIYEHHRQNIKKS